MYKLVLTIDGMSYEKIQTLCIKIEKKFKNDHIRHQRSLRHQRI